MGAEPTQVAADKQSDSRGPGAVESQAAGVPPAFAYELHAEHMFASDPAESASSAANALSLPGLVAPILQRAQRNFGNRSAQRMVTRSRVAQRHCACGGKCADCQNKKLADEEDERLVHRKSSGGGPAAVDAIPTGAGETLDVHTREPLESHFQSDLSGVRVHTDSAATDSAARMDALAYTSGRDIYFAPGMYAPNGTDGKRLLAHEVAHVVQQSSGRQPTIALKSSSSVIIGAPDDPLEAEADSAAEAFVHSNTEEEANRKRPLNEVDQSVIQRQTAPQSSPAATPAKGAVASYGPVGPTMTFEGVLLAANGEYLDQVLSDYIAKHGESEARAFDWRLRMSAAEQVDKSEIEDMDLEAPQQYVASHLDSFAHQPNEAKIAVAVSRKLSEIFESNRKWLADFEAKANEVVLGMLDESEDRVNQERIRYGIGWKDIEEEITRPAGLGDVTYKRRVTQYSMQDTPGSRALAQAATGILTRKHKFDEADSQMVEFGRSSHRDAIGELAAYRIGQGADDPAIIRLNELRAVRNHAKRDLDVFIAQKTAEFPILAAYASGDDISEDNLETLEKLAAGKSPPATEMIGKEIKTRLEHIADVRDDILNNHGKETKIWRIPRIIEGTRAITGATAGTMYGRLVDDKVEDEAPGIWTSILLGLLQLVLVLLAPATGGVTLIGAAAISVGQAYAHFREYERAQMLRGTDFGALALSTEDPSLFWLAVDIVGAGIDVGAAAGAAFNLFRALAPAARAARAAKSAEVMEQEARNLERLAGELGGETLAKAVGRDARAGSEALRVGETAEEAKALERAGEQMAEQEFREGFKEAESIAGRKVKVSEGGSLWSCASPCTLLRERYSGLLRRKGTDWEARLKGLEEEAARIPKGRAGAEARQVLANRAASLEKEMRTAALPGEWTSPLKRTLKAEEFNELVEQRGSIAAELDHHPPDWTGSKEARFRYGEKIDAEPGYRWTLDENGALRYDRLDKSLPPHQYNPATGIFEEAAEGSIIKATKGVDETQELAKIPAKQREAMLAAFKKRGTLIAERDRLEALQEAGKLSDKEGEELRKLYARINEQSRQVGENAAEAVMKQQGGKRIYPIGKSHSTSGDFDQVWKAGDEFHVVEAKGGSSGLGSRSVGEGVRAEQGTVEYAKSIAENMAKNGATKEIRKLGDQLLAAIAKGKFKYVLVRAPIGEELGSAVLRDVRVSEFVLK
jgi:hypothetical protein